MDKKITVVTHSSKFHTDDIFAVATLLLVLGEENVSVVRTRDEEIIKAADYVVDVGGVYNPDLNRFDHHQEGRAGTRLNTIPYAAFGLVWKKFGEQLCGSIEIANKIDEILVQPIDAGDNGFKLTETNIKGIYPYDVGLFFNTFNPSLSEGFSKIDAVFMEAVSIAKTVLSREIFKRQDLARAEKIVEDAYHASENKQLLVFDRYYPAADFLSKFPEPLFVVFPNEDKVWVIKAVQNNKFDFINRKDLPLAWAGKTGKDLESVTGVEGSTFCHNGRFLAVAKTKEAALKLAEIALNS